MNSGSQTALTRRAIKISGLPRPLAPATGSEVVKTEGSKYTHSVAPRIPMILLALGCSLGCSLLSDFSRFRFGRDASRDDLSAREDNLEVIDHVVAAEPSMDVTEEPSEDVTEDVTAEPSEDATEEPSEDVTAEPSVDVTAEPSVDVTAEPSVDVTRDISRDPGVDAACASGLSLCAGGCVNLQRSVEHCGRCENPCAPSLVCDTGRCRPAQSCDRLLLARPSVPSGSYPIDPDLDGPLETVTVHCDMVTEGGGWTLVAASAGGPNMPRFTATGTLPCRDASPSAPCFLGAAGLAASGMVEWRWSDGATARMSTAPIDSLVEGDPEQSAICVSDTEYFRLNENRGSRMSWHGCAASVVGVGALTGAVCPTRLAPVWNLQSCAEVAVSASGGNAPNFTCSPFGAFGSTCSAFGHVRHWRRQGRCPIGQAPCGYRCRDLSADREACGACGVECPPGQMCLRGACGVARSCATLHESNPQCPSGAWPLDPDSAGPVPPFRAWCDMSTEGGGWTLVAASAAATNMPRFTSTEPRPCLDDLPASPCFMGSAALRTLPYTQVVWSDGPTATATRVPLEGHREGYPADSATCVNDNEYFRLNQDVVGQGMAWRDCAPTEVYSPENHCLRLIEPTWNLLRCAAFSPPPSTAHERSSPDYNCSPFGRGNSTCAGFFNIRHWRR